MAEPDSALRVGVVVDALAQPAWIVRAIERVAAAPQATLAVVMHQPRSPREETRPFLPRLYARLDASRFRAADDPLDLQTLPYAVIEGTPQASDVLSLDPALRAYDLDVILAFGPRSATPESLALARLGIWSHLVSDGVWALAARQPATEAVLKRLDADPDGGTVIGTARVATDRISVHRATTRLRWKAASLAERALRDLTAGEPAGRQPQRVTNAGMLLPLVSVAANFAMQKVRDRATDEQWMVAFAFGHQDFRRFHRLEPPRDRMWADPFVIREGERTWIFIEEMEFANPRGVLAVIEAHRDGTWPAPVRILERPYHLSYPCVFRWDGAYWMVPETGGDRTVQLFRATDFPFRWELVQVLLRDIEAVDATPFEHGGRWWLYLTTPSSPRVYDELSIYHAETPLGPWLPHRRNPVLSDIVGGRCGGRPFLRNGRLVRAAQDGAKRYGHAMELREIVTLTPDAWEERVLERILPDWAPGLGGTHTLNVDGDVTVIDGFRDRWRRGGPG
jgi:hypothetical protein